MCEDARERGTADIQIVGRAVPFESQRDMYAPLSWSTSNGTGSNVRLVTDSSQHRVKCAGINRYVLIEDSIRLVVSQPRPNSGGAQPGDEALYALMRSSHLAQSAP